MTERLCWFESSPGHLMIEALSQSDGAFSRPAEPNGVRGRMVVKKPNGREASEAVIQFTAKPGPTKRSEVDPVLRYIGSHVFC